MALIIIVKIAITCTVDGRVRLSSMRAALACDVGGEVAREGAVATSVHAEVDVSKGRDRARPRYLMASLPSHGPISF